MLSAYKLNTLVIDDNITARGTLVAQLQGLGVAHAHTSRNTMTALKMLWAAKKTLEPFDLLVIEYQLENTDGLQLLEVLRTEQFIASSTVVVIVTDRDDFEYLLTLADTLPDTYLIKPFKPDDLYRALLPILERKLGLRHAAKVTPGLKPLYELFDKAQYATVVALTDRLLGSGVKSAVIPKLKAEALYKSNNYAVALEYYQSRQEPWAVLGVTRTLCQLGRAHEAIEILKPIVADTPNFFIAADILANAYTQVGELEVAMTILSKTCEFASTGARLRKAATLAELLKKPAQAASLLALAIEDSRPWQLQDECVRGRLIRNLVKSGAVEDAGSTLHAMEKALPSLSAQSSILAVTAQIQYTQIEAERREIERVLVESVRDSRFRLLEDREAILNSVLDDLAAIQDAPDLPPVAAMLAAETFYLTKDMDLSVKFAVRAVLGGVRLYNDIGSTAWYERVRKEAADAFWTEALNGVQLALAGQLMDAVLIFHELSLRCPTELEAAMLRNTVHASALLQKTAPNAEMDKYARLALSKLQANYPEAEKLPQLQKSYFQVTGAGT